MSDRVLVLGATGTVGRSLLAELAAMDVVVRGATRDAARAKDAAGDGVEWVEFDLERRKTFAAALEDVAYVFMISRPGDEEADKFASPFVDAMKTVNVRHIVDLSAMGAEQLPEFSVRKVELLIEDSGIPFTHLRPNFFMQIHSTGSLGMAIRSARKIALPAADAKLSFIDARDVAGVAARVLCDVTPHANFAYTLTGPEAIDYYQVAAYISAAIGNDVQYLPLDDDATRGMLQAAGVAEPQINRLLGMYRLVRMGACAPISPEVETFLGHSAISFERFAADHASCWK